MSTEQNNNQAQGMNLGFGISQETKSDSYSPLHTAKKATTEEEKAYFPNGS